jgi:hypothetical protein
MMLTALEPEFVTYAAEPFGVIATPEGSVPTFTVAWTVRSSVLMMLTVLEPKLAT